MKRRKAQKPTEVEEQEPVEPTDPYFLKVARGEAPSMFLGDRFMTDAAKKKAEEAAESLAAESLLKGVEWLARRAKERKDVKDLQAQLDALNKQVRGRFAGKRDGLRFYIRVAKRAAIKSGDLNYRQLAIADSVDKLLAKEKTSFSKVCPDSWQKYSPPRLFADVFRIPHHPLRKLAKPYITKTKV